MPKPEKAEKLNHFISRYMKSSEAKKSFPKQSQRAAVAYSEYREKHRK